MDTLVRLHTTWSRVFAEADPKVTKAQWLLLSGAYQKKGRHYHDLEHLAYMFDQLDACGITPEDPECLAAAIFHHDVVYAINRKDNETKSANRAAAVLSRFDWDEDRIQRCERHIRATAKYRWDEDLDTALLVDLDLAILGDTPEKYATYAAQVRREYWMYPDFLYRRGRQQVLQHFLAREQLYSTEYFIAKYSAPAQRNLKMELKDLRM